MRMLWWIRRIWRWTRWLLLALTVVLGVLIYTPLGLQAAVPVTAWLTDDLVYIDQPSGTLAGPFSAREVIIRDESVHLRFVDVRADWNVYRWLLGELDVSSLSIRRFDLAVQGSGEHQDPRHFSLPFPMRAKTVSVQQLFWFADLDMKTSERLLFHDIQAALDSNGTQHHVTASGQRQTLLLQTELDVTGTAPMPMQGHVDGMFTVDERRMRWQLAVDGHVPKFRVIGEVSGENAQGHIDASLTIFQHHWLEALQLNTEGIDLSLIFPGAPKTELIVRADTQLTDVTSMTGTVSVANLLAGDLQQDRLPVDTVSGVLHADLDRLAFTQLVIQRGNGRLDGRAELTAEGLLADMQIVGIDLSAMHRVLPKQRVNGKVTGRIEGKQQLFDLLLNKGRDQLEATLTNTRDQLQVNAFEIRGPSGSASGHAAIQWDEQKAFRFDVQTKNLSLHEWLNLDRSRIEMRMQGEGEFSPALRVSTDYDIAPSVFEGRPLSGKGYLHWLPDQQIETDSTLQIGANRLMAKGRFGSDDARLYVDIDAPDLRLPFLKGALHGAGWIGGTTKKPQAELSLRTEEMIAGDLLHFKNLNWQSNFRLDGDAPTKVHIDAERFFIEDIIDLEALNLDANGTTTQHSLQVQAINPRGQWQLALQGGIKNERWQGQLQKLRLHAVDTLELKQPANLSFNRDQFQLQNAEFSLGEGHMVLNELRYQKNSWQSTGRIQQWPIADWLPVAYAETNLSLNGDWQIRWKDTAEGYLNLQRSGGDVRWRNGKRQELGIETLRARAEFSGQQIVLNGDLQGKTIGHLQLRAGTPSRTFFEHYQQSPLQATLRVDVPDLSWVGPLISANFVTGGNLQGELELRGNLQQPQWRGFLRGDALAFASIGTGMRLKEGEVLIEVDNDAVHLRQFSFVDDGRQKPRRDELRGIGSGGLSGSGSFQWKAQTGQLQLQIDRFGVMQLPDQWIRLSGQTQARYENGLTRLTGELIADGGNLTLASRGRPALSTDVVIEGEERSTRADKLSIQMTADLGEKFYFSGSGIESRLIGKLVLTATPGNPLQAHGTISTVDGKFDGYGQRLSIERGRVNFQGLVDNPGLDVRAMRRTSQVAAGVEISGTVLKPHVRLVSEPNVPDAEKLSWLVLGKGLSDVNADDPGILIAAGNALLGQQEGGALQDIRRQLGVDFSVRSGALADSYGGPRSRVIESQFNGNGGAEEIVGVSKELVSGVRLGFEQVVSSNESIVKLSWSLTNSLSLETRSGEDNAIDLFYTITLGK